MPHWLAPNRGGVYSRSPRPKHRVFTMFKSVRTLAVSQDQELFRVLLLAALSLVTLHFFGGLSIAISSFKELGLQSFAQTLTIWQFKGADAPLFNRLYWAACSDLLYLVLPLLVLRYWGYRPLQAYGLSIRRESGFWRMYGLALMVMVPLVLWMSSTHAFQTLYPFYKPPMQAGWLPRWLIYEVAYISQFFALEFFFRGLLVHGLRPKLGISAVPVMMLPYCMLHFSKPLPEALASILAGMVLGLVSYRSRSIALGFMLHASVALLMDSSVLWRLGYFSLEV